MKGKSDKDFCGSVIPDTFCPVQELQQYTHLGIIKSYAKDSTVIMPGEETLSMILVVDGRIRVNLVSDDGSEKLLYYAGKGALVGRLFPTQNDIYIVATEQTKLCWFSKENLKEIFRTDEEIVFEIIRNYLTKVAYYMRQATEINSYNPTIRILKLIYELCLFQGKQVENTLEVSIALSQKSIAEITGAHYVTVSRVLSCLKKQKILAKKKDKIVIYDLEKLKLLSERSSYY